MRMDPVGMNGGVHPLDPPHSFDYSLCLQRLPEPICAIAKDAIRKQALSYYCDTNLQTWVRPADMTLLVGAPVAMTPVSWFDGQEQTNWDGTAKLFDDAAAGRVQDPAATLMQARHTALRLRQLQADMPPRPYNLRVLWHHSEIAEYWTAPFLYLIRDHRLDTYPDRGCWWLIEHEVRAVLSSDGDIDDPWGDWYIGPSNRIDHDAVARLEAEHRRNWPEVYRALNVSPFGE